MLQAGHHCQSRVCGWVGVHVSHLVAFRLPSCTKDASASGWRLSVGISLTSPCSMNCIGIIFSNGALLAVCAELLSYQQLELFGGFQGTLLAKNSVSCNPFPELEASFDDSITILLKGSEPGFSNWARWARKQGWQSSQTLWNSRIVT